MEKMMISKISLIFPIKQAFLFNFLQILRQSPFNNANKSFNRNLMFQAVGGNVGFFKFLKRDKEQGNDAELDLPPAPPPLEGFEDDKNVNFPEFPQISAPKDDDFKFDFPEEDKMPDL